LLGNEYEVDYSKTFNIQAATQLENSYEGSPQSGTARSLLQPGT
jgi:hypothetical protein